VRRNAERLLGAESIQVVPRPSLGVEDFAFYVSRVPGAFYALGVRDPEQREIHPVHNELFDVDERAIPVGVALQVLNALSILAGGVAAESPGAG